MSKLKKRWAALSGLVGPLVWSAGMVVAAYFATTIGILLAHAWHTRLVRDPIAWFDAHSGVAGWVQGVGSVIAIFVAIGVAWWQNAETRRIQQDREISAALVVAQTTFFMLTDATYWLKQATENWKADDKGIYPRPNFEILRRNLSVFKRPTEEQVLKLTALPFDVAGDLIRTGVIISKAGEMIEHFERGEKAGNLRLERVDAFLEHLHQCFEKSLQQAVDVHANLAKVLDVPLENQQAVT